MPAALVGRTFNERYSLLALIGAGGMGEVYRAHDRELDELVALKVIRAELLADPEMLQRFRREVKLARRVTHHNVARTFELGRDGDVTFCTMELLDGESLTARLAAVRALPVAEVATLGVALCDALEAAHAAGVIHRDIKPDNVLITHGGRVVLSDFGIAAARTTRDDICGTPGYMAPEQARGEPPSPAADIYSLGVVLFEALSGTRPFSGEVVEILARTQRTDHLVLTGIDDPGLVELIAATTALAANRRPTSAEIRSVLADRARPSQEPKPPRSAIGRIDDPSLPAIVIRPEQCKAGAAPHLARGFREALIRRLGRLPRVRVVARDSDPALATMIELTADGDLLQVVVRGLAAAANLSIRFGAEQFLSAVDLSLRVAAAMLGTDAAHSPPEAPLDPRALDLSLQVRQPSFRNARMIEAAVELCERARQVAPEDPRILASRAAGRRRPPCLDREAPGSAQRGGAPGVRARRAAPRLTDRGGGAFPRRDLLRATPGGGA